MPTPEQNTTRQRLDYMAMTNHDLAEDIGTQTRYVLSTLGLMDLDDVGTSLRKALKGARKADLWAILDTLRQIKLAVRDTIEDSKRKDSTAEKADAAAHNATAHDEGRQQGGN